MSRLGATMMRLCGPARLVCQKQPVDADQAAQALQCSDRDHQRVARDVGLRRELGVGHLRSPFIVVACAIVGAVVPGACRDREDA